MTLNKKYNTRYISKRNQDLNIGSYWPYNSINIYNSNKKYLEFFYDSVVTSKNEIRIFITFQKIKEWKIFYPIIGLKIIGGDFDIENSITKNHLNWWHELPLSEQRVNLLDKLKSRVLLVQNQSINIVDHNWNLSSLEE